MQKQLSTFIAEEVLTAYGVPPTAQNCERYKKVVRKLLEQCDDRLVAYMRAWGERCNNEAVETN